jgi:hypothetical protein
MNREFRTTSPMLRVIFATASVLVSILVVGSMSSLADHYHDDAQLASGRVAVVAQR